MGRLRFAVTRRRATALALLVTGSVLGAGVLRSAAGASAATPGPTGTVHVAHSPSPSHAAGSIHTTGGGTTGTGAGSTGSAGTVHGAHTPSPSHAPGSTRTTGGTPAGGTPAGSGTGATGTAGTATSANDRLVQHFYADLVGSQDPSGQAYWSSQLNMGASRDAVAFPLTQTDGYRTMVVSALYQQVMHRPVDAPGLTYWVGRMAQGLTPEQLGASLTGSDEWFANPQFGNGTTDTFITAVYQSLLGRAPDAPGAAYWHNFLTGGGPRWKLTLDFAGSPEWAGQTVTHMFTRYHLGTPSAQGLAFWQGQVEHGLPDDQLAAQLVSSDQYYTWAQTH